MSINVKYKFFQIFILTIFCFGFSFYLNNTASAKGVVNRKVANTKTVGDLLKEYEKRDKIEIKKRQSNLPQIESLKRSKKINLRKVQPSTRRKIYSQRGSTEADLEDATNQAISHLYKLAQEFKRSANRGEIWLRLAEAYVDKSKIIDLKMQQKYDADVTAFNAKRRRTRPRLNTKAARKYNKKAIQLYKWFLRDFPKDRKVDQALFFLGYNVFQLGSPKKGIKYYQRLVKNFPRSSYVSESNFFLGEYYLKNNSMKKALGYYKKIRKKSRLYAFSLYKMAWAHYKLGNTKTALRGLRRIIIMGNKASSYQDSDNILRISDEATKDIIAFYASVGRAKNAKAYFLKLFGEDKSEEFLKKLASYYKDTGDVSGARYLFKKFIRKDPLSIAACNYQYQIIKMYASSGQRKIFGREISQWAKNFGPQSKWREYNSSNRSFIAKIEKEIESVYRNHVLRLHSTAKKTKSRFTQAQAKKAYQLYLSTFKEAGSLGEVHFFFGELLFDMKRYNSAARQYLWVVDNATKSKYFKKAVLNSVLSFEKLLPTVTQIKKRIQGRKGFVKIQPNVQAFIDAVQRYIKYYPRSKNRSSIEYRVGSLYYYYNQYDKALPIFFGLVRKNPRSKRAEYAANLILDIYNIKKDYVGLDKAADELLSIPSLRSTSIGKQIRSIKSRSQFKKLESLGAGNNYIQSAKAYEEYARTNKTGSLVLKALFNAAVNYEKANLLNDSLRVYRLFFLRKPKNRNLIRQARQFMALNYEKLGNYQEAAKSYEKFYRENPKNIRAMDFIYNAAVIRDGLRHDKLALANYSIYYNKSRRKDRSEVLFLKAKIRERRKEYSKAKSLYNKYTKSRTKNADRIIESIYKIAVLNSRLKRISRSYIWYKKVVATHQSFARKGKQVGVRYAAESKFKLVQHEEYKRFVSIKIPRNIKKQASALKSKIARIEKLKAKLKLVIQYNDAYQVVAALTLQGDALRHMAKAIYDAPVPKGLKKSDLKIYKEGVDNIARPFKEQAQEIYGAAVKKAIDLGVYSNWTKRAYKFLVNKRNYGQKSFSLSSLDSLGYKMGRRKSSLKIVYSRLGDNSKDLKALNALAIYHIERSEHGLAQVIFDRILKNHLKTAALSNNMAVNYLRRGEKRKAVAEFKQAIKLSGFSSKANSNLASILLPYYDYQGASLLLEGVYNSIETDFGLIGNDFKIVNNYALALLGTGDAQEAKKIFKKIIKSKQTNMTVLFNYAILLGKALGNKPEALKYIRKIKLLSPNRSMSKKIKALEVALR